MDILLHVIPIFMVSSECVSCKHTPFRFGLGIEVKSLLEFFLVFCRSGLHQELMSFAELLLFVFVELFKPDLVRLLFLNQSI